MMCIRHTTHVFRSTLGLIEKVTDIFSASIELLFNVHLFGDIQC